MNLQVLDSTGLASMLAGPSPPAEASDAEFGELLDVARRESSEAAEARSDSNRAEDGSRPERASSTDEDSHSEVERSDENRAETDPSSQEQGEELTTEADGSLDGEPVAVPLGLSQTLSSHATPVTGVGGDSAAVPENPGSLGVQQPSTSTTRGPLTTAESSPVATTSASTGGTAEASTPTRQAEGALVASTSGEAAKLESVSREQAATQSSAAPLTDGAKPTAAKLEVAQGAQAAGAAGTSASAETQPGALTGASGSPGPTRELGGFFQQSGSGTKDGGDPSSPRFFLLDGDKGDPAAPARGTPAEAMEAKSATPPPVSAPASSATPGNGANGTPTVEGLSVPNGSGTDSVSSLTGTSVQARVNAADGARAPQVLSVNPNDQPEMADKLYRVVRRSIRQGGGDVHLRIDPPELGRVDLEVRLRGDRVDIAFQVDDEGVREAILKHIDQLHRALESYGLSSEGVSVDLRDPSGGEHSQNDHGDARTRGAAEASEDDLGHPETRRLAGGFHIGTQLDRVA